MSKQPARSKDPRSADALLHELEVYEVELEAQNETLRQSQNDLMSSRERYIDFYDFAPVGFLTLNEQGQIVEINLTGATLLGVERAWVLGKHFSGFVLPADQDRWHRHLIRMRTESAHQNIELELQGTQSARRFVEMDSLRLERDGHCSVGVVFSEISERKQKEKDMRVAATVFDSSQSMAITDLDCVILKVNRAFTNLTGYSAEEAVGCHIRLLKSGLNDAAFYAAMWDLIVKNGYWQGEICNRKKGGELYVQWLTITAVRGEDGKPSHYVGTQTDITDRVSQHEQMQRDLTAYAMRLNLASRQLMSVQEETRRRLAGELHDRTKPNLAAMNINLGIVESQIGNDYPQLVERLADTRALVEDTEASIREICAELRPAVLDYAGLEATLDSYCFKFGKRTGIEVSFDSDYVAGSLSPAEESTLFRVCQEALTNVSKHASARTIEVELKCVSKQVSLSIVDDGCGFDAIRLDHPDQPTLYPGLGLLNMREMVMLFGGNLVILSQPGQGTRVTVNFHFQESVP